MPRTRAFQISIRLTAFPACGKRSQASSSADTPRGGGPGLDDLPLEETEALAQCIREWIEGVESKARALRPSAWTCQMAGAGDSQEECRDDAIRQCFTALGPLCQALSHPDVLARTVQVAGPTLDVWIQITSLIHIIITSLRNEEGQVAIWEIPFASPALGQVWIAVSVALDIRIERA